MLSCTRNRRHALLRATAAADMTLAFYRCPIAAVAAAPVANDAKQVVSYKWLARQYALPSNHAKRCDGGGCLYIVKLLSERLLPVLPAAPLPVYATTTSPATCLQCPV